MRFLKEILIDWLLGKLTNLMPLLPHQERSSNHGLVSIFDEIRLLNFPLPFSNERLQMWLLML